MSHKWTIRLAAVLTILTFSAQPAQSQVFFRPFIEVPYGGYGTPFSGYGNPYGGYGMPYGGYGGMPYGYGGYGGYGGGYSSYSTPGYTTPGYGYSYSTAPVVISPGPGASTGPGGGARTQLAPAVAVPQDSTLLLAGWSAPTNDNRAVVVIMVPDAQTRISVEGSATQQSGKIRRFTSPQLAPNKLYEYTIRAQWTDANGAEQTETQVVPIRAGGVVEVIFARKDS